MLKIENLSVSFGDKKIIEDLSYDFLDGHATAITGASGIGKTTLVNVLAGLIKQNDGRIISTYKKPSYVFQEHRLFPWMTALENVSTVCEDPEKARFLLHRLINDEDIDGKYPDELSGGMRQRVSLARALAYDPDIVFMDEPFKGLDADTRGDVRQFVFEYLHKKTVILVTHDAEDTAFCDTVLRMNGSPVTSLTVEECGKGRNE